MGKWGTRAFELSTYPQTGGRSRRSGSRDLPFGIFNLGAGGIEAGKTPGPVEHGQASVRVFVDPDFGLDVVVAVTVGGDLERQAVVAHGVVIADDALVLEAKDVRQIAGEGDEGSPGLIAVDPEYRGTDIGGRLLRTVESVMAPPLRKLSVMTEKMNTRALGLYARAGFTVRQSWDVWHAHRGNGQGHGVLYGSERS